MFRAAWDTFASAMGTLRANKLRSALTLLGIVIGVVAVVAMSATTEGLRRRINTDLAQLGTGVFQVQREPIGFDNPRKRALYEKRKAFTMADVTMLQQRCKSCLRVGGETWQPPQRVNGPEGRFVNGTWIVGGTTEFFDNNGYALATGRFYDDAEAQTGGDLIVIGSDVADVLFPSEQAVGQYVQVKEHRFRVIGTMERRGSNLGGSIDNIVVIPIGTFLPMYGMQKSLHVTVQARDPDKMGRAQDEVVSLLRKQRGVAPEDDNDFEIFSNASIQDTFEKISGSIALASIGICAIALLIGGIGVMNIMLVAVTERTSEIGVRRALGARRRRILAQFVVEAIMLTSTGGALGVVMGAFVAYLVKVLVDLPTVIPMWAVAISMVSAGGVGLLFGIYPAYRASRLDPVEAMRHE